MRNHSYMNRISRWIGLAAILAFAPVAFAQVPLYAQPDASSQVIGLVPASDPAIASGQPVMDEEAREAGWHWTEYEGTFTGYVSAEDLDKENVESGSIVRLEPSAESPVLTVVTETDEPEVLSVAEFAEIRFSKAVPAYFLKPSTQPAPEERAAAATSSETDSPPRSATSSQAKPDRGEYRSVQGTLESVGGINPFGRFGYGLKLVDSDGDLLFYVDAERMLGAAPVKTYLGRTVQVTGYALVDDKGRRVLQVRSIRPR